MTKISGFHHDFMHAIEQSDVIQFLEKVVEKTGVYTAKLYYKGQYVDTKSFFPANWSREQVISKIYEAYDNFIKSGVSISPSRDGKYLIDTFTNEGIKIRIHMTKKGLIKSAYPILG